MQAKKNKQLALSFAILMVTVVTFYFSSFKSNTLQIDPSLFRVDDLASIDRVELESSKGKITLRFEGARWMVNDRYDADRQMIKVLFATLDQVVPRRPVSKSLMAGVGVSMERNAVHVRLLAGDQILKDFHAGGNAQKTEAYFKSAGGEPYVMSIPGYRVYASGVFEQLENDWRDKRVFAFNWRNFKTLTTSFPGEKGAHFTITLRDRYFGVEGIALVDTTRLNNYLDAVSLLNATRFYQPGQSDRFDSLFLEAPSFSIEVEDIASRTYRLDIFPPLRNENSVPGRINGEAALFAKNDIVQIAKKKIFFRRTGPNDP